MAVMKMAFPAEYIAGIMAPGLAAAAPAGMPAAGPAAAAAAAAPGAPAVERDMSDGGPAEEATEAPADAVPGTRGTPYMTALA